MKKLFYSFALTLSAISAPVQAQAPARIAVSHADLDLSGQAGVRTLDARLAHAVRLACAVDKDERILSVSVEQRRCVTAQRKAITASRQAAIAAANATPRTLAAR